MSAKHIVGRSLTQLRTNPLRTLLTLLGVVFGVASVVAMVSIGEGAQRQILAMIEALGATNVHIVERAQNDTEVAKIVEDSVGLSAADAEALRAVVPGVQAVAFRKRFDLTSTDILGGPQNLRVFGVNEALFALHGLRVQSGRALGGSDHRDVRRVAVVGANLARSAFPSGAVGAIVRLDYAFFEVVGVLEESASAASDLPFEGTRYGDAVIVPYAALLEELAPERAYGELDMISLRMPSLESTLAAKRAGLAVLGPLHGGVADYDLIAPEEILEQKKATQNILNIVLVCIAAISLLVGGIGVMNIMLANIMERVAEIGLRRAVGARKRDIRNQFLAEAVVICVIGGAIGIALGFAISFTVGFFAELPAAFVWEAMAISFIIASMVGVGFGYVPAARAANIDPIRALRNE